MVGLILVSRIHDPSLGTINSGLPFGSGTSGADLDGDGTVDLPNFTASMSAYVPTDGFAEASIMILSGAQKVTAPIACLASLGSSDPACSGNTDVEYSTAATITLRGIEETSGDEVIAVTGVQILIGPYGS